MNSKLASSVALLLLLPSLTFAAQIIPTGVEYTNDTIEQGGQLQACIVTTAIISPPAPEIVNFQFLIVLGQPAFKVTAADVDWVQKSSVAKRSSSAEFYTAQFNHQTAFRQSVTPEGQILALLTDPTLRRGFLEAFLGGDYSIRFKRTDLSDERFYHIQQSPSDDVQDTFAKCVHTLTSGR
jgi:hypothetical protein